MLFRRVTRRTKRPRTDPDRGPDRKPETYTSSTLEKAPKTTMVLIAPRVLAEFFEKAAAHPDNETGALLVGTIDGKHLLIEDLAHAQSLGDRASIRFSPADFETAGKSARNGQLVVGWIHSHPGHGVFHSTTDVRFQSQGQGLFPDFIGLVMDPFDARGIGIGCYRARDARPVRLPHHYLIQEDAE